MLIVFLDLKTQNPTIQKKTLVWVRTFTPELDFETGELFTQFVQCNLKLEYPFSVFVLQDLESQEVIGTASIIPDDQDVGKENNLDGIWIAGVMIKREHRGKGYGATLFKNVDNYLYARALEKPLRVNLFVCNPIALALYEKFGFKKIGLKVIRHDKENEVCSKYYTHAGL
jgi:RimJ/RimL family protein N-acetyltransferase